MRIVWRHSLYDNRQLASPRVRPSVYDAYRFIAFASSPERQQALSEQVTYGPTTAKPLELLPAHLAGGVPSSTPNLAGALRIDTAFWIEHGDALERRFNAWAPPSAASKTTKTMTTTSIFPYVRTRRGTCGKRGPVNASRIGQPGDPSQVSRTVAIR